MLTTSAKSSEGCSGGCSGFERTAAVYDLIHGGRDLDREAKVVLEEMGPLPAGYSAMIDWGAGTGSMLPFWIAAGYSTVTGVDSSPEMIAVAASKGFSICQLDMRAVEKMAPRTRIVQVCLFASFSYACLTNDDLLAALRNFRQHSVAGGMLVFDCVNYACAAGDLRRFITMPAAKDSTRYIRRDIFKDFHPASSIVTVKTEFSCHWHKEKPDDAKGDVLYRIDRWTDIHKLRAFTPLEIAAALDRAGFATIRQFDPETGGNIRGNSYYFMTTAQAR